MSGDRRDDVKMRIVAALRMYVTCIDNDEERDELAENMWLLYSGVLHRKYGLFMFPVDRARPSGKTAVFRNVPERVMFFNSLANIILGDNNWLINEEESKKRNRRNAVYFYRSLSQDYWMSFQVKHRDLDDQDWWMIGINVIENGHPRGFYPTEEEDDDAAEWRQMSGGRESGGVESVGWSSRKKQRDGEGGEGGAGDDSDSDESDPSYDGSEGAAGGDAPVRGTGSRGDFMAVLRELHERLKRLEAK